MFHDNVRYILSKKYLLFHLPVRMRALDRRLDKNTFARRTCRPAAMSGASLYPGALPWVSYQIHKIAGCECVGNAGNVFPATMGQRSRHALRHVRDARAVMHAGIAN